MEEKPFKFRYERKLVHTYEELEEIVKKYRAEGKKIVTTAGVFDMIHDGHAKYMELAENFGDVLILGVDSDELTQKTKGKNRPFDKVHPRIVVLGAMEAVHHMKVRSAEENEEQFIRVVRPDVLVISYSSNQYTKPGGESFPDLMERLYIKTGIAKELRVLEPQSSNSTSAKMRELMKMGIAEFVQEMLILVEEKFGIPFKLFTEKEEGGGDDKK